MAAPTLSAHAFRSLARLLAHPFALLGAGLDPRLRERIVLRVSSVNSCVVCSAVHAKAAALAGLSEAQIRAAREGDEQACDDDRTRIALRYAEIRTADLEHESSEDVRRFEQAFVGRERAAVRALVDAFTFANRFNNTWEALLPGAQRRRARMGIRR
jgi:AhpD family alkylhydroperoxidase